DGPVPALVLQKLLHATLGLLQKRLAALHQLDPLLELLERVLEAELPALELLDHLLEAVHDVAVALARLFSRCHGPLRLPAGRASCNRCEAERPPRGRSMTDARRATGPDAGGFSLRRRASPG